MHSIENNTIQFASPMEKKNIELNSIYYQIKNNNKLKNFKRTEYGNRMHFAVKSFSNKNK